MELVVAGLGELATVGVAVLELEEELVVAVVKGD